MSEITDCNGTSICVGATVRRVSDGETGKVVEIVLPETHKGKTRQMCHPVYFGDLVVRTSGICTTISNNYKNWEVIKVGNGSNLNRVWVDSHNVSEFVGSQLFWDEVSAEGIQQCSALLKSVEIDQLCFEGKQPSPISHFKNLRNFDVFAEERDIPPVVY